MLFEIAEEKDWQRLYKFYKRVYRDHHPLQNFEFWKWQYGSEKHGRAFIASKEDGEIVGHAGASFGGGYAWIINVYLDEKFRGKGALGNLYSLARAFYPLAASSANEAGLGLYRNMSWYRYCDLQRYILINPAFSHLSLNDLLAPVNVNIELQKPEGHYWEQPGLSSHQFSEGSTYVIQKEIGGIRVVDIANLNDLVSEAWQSGYKWMDYISSWNDKKLRQLEEQAWVIDYKSIIPWKLDPIVEGATANVSYLSEEPVPKNFVVHRSYSDHGRVGSIKTADNEHNEFR